MNIKKFINICMLVYSFKKDNADIKLSLKDKCIHVKGEGYAHDLNL